MSSTLLVTEEHPLPESQSEDRSAGVSPHLPRRTIIGKEAATGLPICGFNLIWQLRGIRTTRKELQQALNVAGLSEHMPEPVSARVALRRALEAWVSERAQIHRQANTTNTGEESELQVTETADAKDSALKNKCADQMMRTLIRVINKRGSEQVVFAIVAEAVDFTGLGLSYGTSLRIKLDKRTNGLSVTTEARGEIEAATENTQLTRELEPYWREFRDVYLSADLAPMVRRMIIQMDSVSVRREGGVYFVPAHMEARVRAVQSLLERLSGAARSSDAASYLTALPVAELSQSRHELARAVHDGLVDELRNLAVDLARFTDAPEGTVRHTTVAERLTLYRELKRKTGMYEELLAMRRDDIDGALRELESRARSLVTNLDKIAAG